MTPADTSTKAPNLCFKDLIKFNLALSWDDCLKNRAHVFGGVTAAILLFGEAVLRIPKLGFVL